MTAQVFSRKFNNRLTELLQAIEAAAGPLRNTSNPNLRGRSDPEVAGLTNLERLEIGDANPMCHIITFRKRLLSLNYVAANCMRDTVFDDCCQPIFVALRTSGIYPIEYGRKGYAYCDMETDGGGWVVVARRAGGKRNFNKTWRHYKKGFGPLDKDFWIGLDAMYLLTHPEAELRFDMRHKNGSWYHAYYSQIIVGPESDNYMLTVHGYDPERSTIYDAFSTLNGHPFSTKDNVNVNFQPATTCPGRLNRTGAGWWWSPSFICYRVNMNSQYHLVYNPKGDTYPRGIGWCNVNLSPCRYPDAAFQFIEMKVRPRQWYCENRPRIAWETVQHQFLYREEEEEDEGGEDEKETPTSNATTATPASTLSEPVPDTENEHVAPTDSAEERGSGRDMVSPVDKAATATPGAEEDPDPVASTMAPPTPTA